MNDTRAGLVLLIPLLTFLSCSGNEPGDEYQLRTDMYNQRSFRHNEDPRPQVEGTVPTRGFEPAIRDSAGAAALKNPFTMTRASGDTARILFETYCSPCHGLGGKGDGPVASKFQVPPDLTSQKYRKAPDGYIYSVIRNGVRIMPAYDENTTARERWLILSHVRNLQTQ